MTFNHSKILFILPHPTWKADKYDQILQPFLKMQSEVEIQILSEQKFLQPSKILTKGSHTNAFLLSFRPLGSGYLVDEKISVINFFDDESIIATQFKITDLYHAYLNVFNNEETLLDLVGRGYGLDYSKDVVLKFRDEDHDLLEANVLKLVKCLVK